VLIAANESSYTGAFAISLNPSQLMLNEMPSPDTGDRKYDQGDPHPLGQTTHALHKLSLLPRLCPAWYQEHGAGVESSNGSAGRSFFTSLEHLNETWQVCLRLSHSCLWFQKLLLLGHTFSPTCFRGYTVGPGLKYYQSL